MDDEQRQKLEEAEAKIKRGEPVLETAVLEIIDVKIKATGEVAVDFVFGKFPQGQDAVGRLALTPEAAQILKSALANSENIPDRPSSTPDPQSRN